MVSGTTSKYKAMIFDMDGTLTDTMFAWRGVFREFIKKHGLTVPEQLEGVPEYPGSWAAKLWMDQIPERTLEDVVGELVHMVDWHYANDAQVKTDAPELVRRLREKGYKLAVATATQLKYANTALNRLGYTEMFDLITSVEEIGVGKNSPEFFKRVAERLGVQPEECVMFEDALHAIKSAKQAGMRVVAIEEYYSWREREEIRALADRYLTCYAELLEEME